MTDNNKKPGFGDDIDVLTPSAPAEPPVAGDSALAADSKPAPKKTAKPKKKLPLSRRPRLKTRHHSFYLADEQIAKLELLSQQTDRSRSDLVRQALSEFLHRH